ncbi:MAG: ABC transporter ATP-binding protein [Anaerolineae bacterium]|nr:MAG: ABC transporter ATP-binding protein [Anaerolineae bacterium]
MKDVIRLVALLKPYGPKVLVAVVCLLATTGLSLAVPWFIKQTIDLGLTGGQSDFLVVAGLSVAGLGVVKGLFSFGQRYLSEWLAQRLAYDLRNALYDHIQRLSFTYHDRAQTGQLMTRCITDINAVLRFASVGLLDSLFILALTIGALTVMLRAHWQLTLIAFVPVLAIAGIALNMGRVLRPMFRRMREQYGLVTTVLQENLTGVQVVKALAREPHEIDKFETAAAELLRRRITLVRVFSFNMPLTWALMLVSTALILWFGGRWAVAGEVTVGTLVAFNSYALLLSEPMRRLGFLANLTAEAIASGERIWEILDTGRDIQASPDAVFLPRLEGGVRFEDVSFRYGGSDEWVLRDVSLEARPGQVVALLGPTGSGKSTVINLIPRFYDVTAGRVMADGWDVRDVTLESLRCQIGIVLQESLLFSATIGENIAYGRTDATDDEIVAVAKVARAHEFILEFPDGYDTLVGERGVTLSGGQRQRVAIARALLMDPRILILDDSTSSVDTETEYLIQQALQALMRGRTTFVIAQRLQTVLNADQILVLDGGRIVERGTHEELIARDGLYKEIYDLQLKDQERLRRELLALGGVGERQEARWRKTAFGGAMSTEGVDAPM